MVQSSFLLAICLCSLLCFSAVNSKSFDFKFCIDHSMFQHILHHDCNTVRMKKTISENPIERKEIATGFLNKRIFTKRNSEPARPTTYHEECCVEGCSTEEIMEYC